MAGDRAIVHEEAIGDAAKALHRFSAVGTDGLLAQVAACRDHGEPRRVQEKMMQRRVGEHHAEIRVAGSDALGDRRAGAFAEQHDRRLRGGERRGLGRVDPA